MLEIVVVGGGIAGFSAALALWDRGAAVTLVEESRPGAAATGASAGMVVAQYESGGPGAMFQLCMESRALYAEFASRIEQLSGQQLDLRWDGMLVANLSDEEHAEAEETVLWQREAGLEAEVLDPAVAAGLQPGVATDVISYLWLPQEGQLDSQRLGTALTAAIAGTGIRLISGNGVAEVLSSDGRVIGVAMADGRTLEAERVVLAAGAWSGTIGGLPRELPVRPVRGQIARFPAKTLGLMRIVASHTGRYLVPRSDDTVLGGSTMEDVGFDRSFTDAGLQTIYESVSGLVPALAGLKPIERWAGLRPISADLLPIIGPDPDLEGLIYATGYGRDGITLAPVTGVMVAELVLTGESEHDWQPFRPDRFSEPS
jgi:glycine oxidase